MLTAIDQMGNRLQLNSVPKRIVSLVPSQSEYLWELGLRDELVGITKFCIHPDEMFRQVTRVGGTKELDLDKIRTLKPDVIIGNKEENTREQILRLQEEFPVWMSDIVSLPEAIGMMEALAKLCGKEQEAEQLLNDVQRSIAGSKNRFSKQRVLYFMWNNPYMGAGANTFINTVLEHVGFINTLSGLERYPVLDADTLRALNPQVCLLSSEPFPFNQKHVAELQRILPQSTIQLVDGEMFSWYGSRLKHLATYLDAMRR